MIEYDFKRLTDLYGEAGARDKFEDGCTELLQLMYQDSPVHNVKASQGDGGIDVFIGEYPNDIEVYQCKYFYGSMNSSRWSQVRHSFERAMDYGGYTMKKWGLCVSCHFTNDDFDKWDKFQADMRQKYQISDLKFDLKSEETLINLMKQHGVYNRFFHIDIEENIQKIYQHIYGSTNIEEEYKDAISAQAVDNPNQKLLNDLIAFYLKGDFTSVEKNFGELCPDLTVSLSAVQKDACYWMGMAEKNISGDNQKACSHFEFSDTAHGWYEIYRIRTAEISQLLKEKDKKENSSTEQEKLDDQIKELTTNANNAFQKAIDKNDLSACYQMAKQKLSNISEASDPESEKTEALSLLEIVEKCNPQNDTTTIADKADALYLLYKYMKAEDSEAQKKKEQRLQKSLYLGSQLAYDEMTRATNPLIPSNTRSYSSKKGICVINTSNERAEWFCRSVPAEWKLYSTAPVSEKENQLGCEPLSQLVYGLLHHDLPIKYVLIDDDFHKNLHDAIELLENLRQSKILENRQNIEIYLRGITSQVSPIIDTILNCMGETAVPVHIIDEDRAAAQILLSQHPLFYPQWKHDSTKPVHATIIGDNECALWMLRESSWMMDNIDKTLNKTGDISVLAPKAEQLGKRFRTLCPGLYGPEREPIETWLNLPKYHFIQASLSDGSLIELIQQQSYPSDYIIVCLDKDEENLELAIQLRQVMVRKYRYSPDQMPVIAYHCHDNYLAFIGKRTVVESEKFGHIWTNSYQLLPFGSYELYSWQNMMESIVDEIGKCVHLGYCGIPSSATPEKRDEALLDYYEREYNRDSSYSVALCLPYRLWKTLSVKELHSLTDSDNIFYNWRFEDDNFFFSQEGAERIASFLDKYSEEQELFSPDELDEMAKWEHHRWCRWMLSRGHLPMTIQQMVHFISLGNRRQNLSVGKLHSIICPYDEIEQIEKQLSIARDDKRANGYLRNANITNIQDSIKFWRREWYHKAKEK